MTVQYTVEISGMSFSKELMFDAAFPGQMHVKHATHPPLPDFTKHASTLFTHSPLKKRFA